MNQLLKSVQFVSDHSTYVKINSQAIVKYISDFQPVTMDHWMKACPFTYHPMSDIDDEIDRWFLSDAMAFCFWGYPNKWTIEYQGTKIDGWWALLACIERALESGIPLTHGSYLANISIQQAHELFAGSPEIPLFSERVEAFHDIGHTLVDKYDGRFHNYLNAAPHNAVELVTDLSKVFPIFDDISIYQGQKIYFYKKAQLLVHDITVGFPETKYANITNIGELTGEADYKIPALLRKLGILVYSPELSNMVDNRIPLPADSPMEVEIRANMLYACHLICDKLNANGVIVDAATLDGILWVQSQTKSPDDKPYHLTLTTDY